jgi:hypothetical protein
VRWWAWLVIVAIAAAGCADSGPALAEDVTIEQVEPDTDFTLPLVSIGRVLLAAGARRSITTRS